MRATIDASIPRIRLQLFGRIEQRANIRLHMLVRLLRECPVDLHFAVDRGHGLLFKDLLCALEDGCPHGQRTLAVLISDRHRHKVLVLERNKHTRHQITVQLGAVTYILHRWISGSGGSDQMVKHLGGSNHPRGETRIAQRSDAHWITLVFFDGLDQGECERYLP